MIFSASIRTSQHLSICSNLCNTSQASFLWISNMVVSPSEFLQIYLHFYYHIQIFLLQITKTCNKHFVCVGVDNNCHQGRMSCFSLSHQGTQHGSYISPPYTLLIEHFLDHLPNSLKSVNLLIQYQDGSISPSLQASLCTCHPVYHNDSNEEKTCVLNSTRVWGAYNAPHRETSQ